MKKILFLGGSFQQIPPIKYAKEHGYYTILCDYQTNTPCQHYSDKYYCVSTTDKDAILEVATKENINGIVAYVSDRAAPTASYVANKLNLPSNPYEAVSILTRKDLFRKFLKDNGFNCPRAKSYKTLIEAKEDLNIFHFPLMVKPIDSASSIGVSRIDSMDEFDKAFNLAILNSREKTVIIEEYIEMTHEHQIGGDIFIVDGMLEFCGFLNCHRNDQINPNAPIGKSYPLFLDEQKTNLVRKELERLINLLKMKTGALNIEVIIGRNEKVYFIDIGPRNGGNMIPEFLKVITGIDFVKAIVETALGNKDINFNNVPKEKFYATYTLHSAKKGELQDIIFSNEIEENIINNFIYKVKGEEIEIFNNGTKALGYVFLRFASLEELKNKMKHINQLISVKVN
ncbi:ATP-grasp domain-containing protein [Neobacillus drentensis]|uniref:ATP-grasp domain-containing protein n=1 Tax=Neobacillus drentensis TaxID=220684 RepID=UPI0030002FAA